MTDMTYVRCPGCGVRFKGERGLRAHQSQRHVTLACKPRVGPEWCGCGCAARTPCSCATECQAASHRSAQDALWRLRNLTGEPRLTEGDEDDG
jgi:hypothetical protein